MEQLIAFYYAHIKEVIVPKICYSPNTDECNTRMESLETTVFMSWFVLISIFFMYKLIKTLYNNRKKPTILITVVYVAVVIEKA